MKDFEKIDWREIKWWLELQQRLVRADPGNASFELLEYGDDVACCIDVAREGADENDLGLKVRSYDVMFDGDVFGAMVIDEESIADDRTQICRTTDEVVHAGVAWLSRSPPLRA